MTPVGLYAQALALLPADDDDRPTLLLLYGRAASSSGVDADAELIEATEWFLAAADVERAAQAMLARTWFLWNAGGDLESSRLLERGRGSASVSRSGAALRRVRRALDAEGPSRRRGELRRLDEYLPLVDQAGHSLADAALALTLLGREAEFGELPPIVRRSRWGIAAGAFGERDFATAAALYQGMGTRVHEAEARLRLARQHAAKGGQAEADHEAAAAAAFFLGAGAEPRLAESQAAIRASA